MCGIAGAFGVPAMHGAVHAMRNMLRHRGPDDEGEARLELGDACVGAFGHTRLSILDLSPAGHQPKWSPDRRFAITYNGEIYNFRELRTELELAGETFESRSDTEVLLAGWARWGSDILPRLRGMFAFALWDSSEGCLYLCRDRFGMKPLYFTRSAGVLLFASELRALLSTGRPSRELSPAGVATYLAWGACAEPETMLTGIEMLPAGQLLRATLERGDVRLELRCTIPILDGHPSQESDPLRACELVRSALRESVRLHMVSDVPIGFFLSGGIDSSALVAFAAELEPAALSTFTIVFPEREYSEIQPARALAAHFATDHHEIELRAGDVLGMLPEALLAMDQPSMDGVNTYAVSRVVRERGITVVLSGLGGDELFGGYPSFRRSQRIAPLWRLPGGARTMAAAGLRLLGADARAAEALAAPEPASAAYSASRRLFSNSEVLALCGSSLPLELEPAPDYLSLFQRISWHELSGYMRNVLLRDSDGLSMAHGLELRLPFLNTEVVRAAFSIADSAKLRPGVSKPVLSDVIRSMVPSEIWNRPKQGFTFPFARWLRADLRDEIKGTLTRDRLARVGLDANAVAKLWRKYDTSAPRLWSRVWALYVLVKWAELHDLSVNPGIALPGTRHG